MRPLPLPLPSRARLAWASTAVAGALVITAIAVGGGTRPAGIELEQPRTLAVQDAFPVPNRALREYLEHTGGSSKLARLNPTLASRIEARDAGGSKLSASAAGGQGIQARLQALHVHQMVSCARAVAQQQARARCASVAARGLTRRGHGACRLRPRCAASARRP